MRLTHILVAHTTRPANRPDSTSARAAHPSPISPASGSLSAPLTGTPARKDLLTIEHLPTADLLWILDRSDLYQQDLLSTDPMPAREHLRGRTIANLFFENSTRTRTSFELAEKRLGAEVVSLSASTSSLSKGESLLDTVRVLESMKLDAIVVRHAATGVPAFLADRVKPHLHIINAGDGAHEHPTQALLDAAELRAALGDLKGKRVVIVGDILHSRVARSNFWLLKKLGASVAVAGPSTLLPRDLAEVFGVEVFTSLDPAVEGADAIIALRIQLERQSRGYFPTLEEYRERYGLQRTAVLEQGSLILHPGPVNLGTEVGMELAYGPRSLILQQVRRGVAVRMAVLDWLFS